MASLRLPTWGRSFQKDVEVSGRSTGQVGISSVNREPGEIRAVRVGCSSFLNSGLGGEGSAGDDHDLRGR